jgi:hypothetical protein
MGGSVAVARPRIACTRTVPVVVPSTAAASEAVMPATSRSTTQARCCS